MEYTVNHLAKLSGVSTRTLRYYDKIGLLKPQQIRSNGYRIYGEHEIDLLQQILFYRALDFSLEEIKEIVYSPSFNREQALKSHLSSLETKKEQIELLIENVRRTITSLKGDSAMNDSEKFEGLKQSAIKENEQAYGQEIREKYGDKFIDSTNAKLTGMTKDQWNQGKELEEQIKLLLIEAVHSGDCAGAAAKKLCDLHRQWLLLHWPDGAYSKAAHLELAESYVTDGRFKTYYEDIVAGGAQFIRDALANDCRN